MCLNREFMVLSEENVKNEANSDQIRDVIIDSAEQLFAEKGYEGTSVRSITTLANCNVAAINYHFGGKDNLYKEMFQCRLAWLREVRVGAINEVMACKGGDVRLEDLLEAFARAFVAPLVSETKSTGLLKLFAREMLDPHLPKGMLFEEMLLPVCGALQKSMQQICPFLGDYDAFLCIHSFISQLIHSIHTQDVVDHAGNNELPAYDLEASIKHIVSFTAAGIYSKQGGSNV
jgi:AcrR family transcriptional regulator